MQVKTPTASLFSCENSHDDVTLAVNQNINVSGQSEDSVNVFNQSEDNVFDQSECNDFETRDKLEVKRAGTPQPLFNTIVGVQANFCVSYPIHVITRVKCTDV